MATASSHRLGYLAGRTSGRQEALDELEEVLWCWTHSDSRIYGQSAERDGRGTLYCRTYYGPTGKDCDIRPRGMEKEPRE